MKCSLVVFVGVVALLLLSVAGQVFGQIDTALITRDKVESAEKLIGLTFTEAEQDSMLDALKEYARNYDSLRTIKIDNNIPPALMLNPLCPAKVPQSAVIAKFSPGWTSALPAIA